jgi:hypothetical protein
MPKFAGTISSSFKAGLTGLPPTGQPRQSIISTAANQIRAHVFGVPGDSIVHKNDDQKQFGNSFNDGVQVCLF